jgi:hypothetical protein
LAGLEVGQTGSHTGYAGRGAGAPAFDWVGICELPVASRWTGLHTDYVGVEVGPTGRDTDLVLGHSFFSPNGHI